MRPTEMARRELFLTAGALGLSGVEGAHAMDRPAAPRLELAFEAIVDIAPLHDLGVGPLGVRRMVPITGGVFEGPRIRGMVLPGGADRQLIRADGARLLRATYELQADDGAVISVENRVLSEDRPGGGRYAFSHIDLTAPEGAHGWLNHAVFVGTLGTMRPQREAVRITVYALA